MDAVGDRLVYFTIVVYYAVFSICQVYVFVVFGTFFGVLFPGVLEVGGN